MALYPISATLQKAYRDVLLIPQAPAYIDSDEKVIPVAIVADVAGTSEGASSVKITDGTDDVLVETAGNLNVAKSVPKGVGTGRTLVHITGYIAMTANTGNNIYTVTSGKKFYITEMYIGGTTASQWAFDDATTRSFASNTNVNNDSFVIGAHPANGTTPVRMNDHALVYETNVTATFQTTANYCITIIGFEEA